MKAEQFLKQVDSIPSDTVISESRSLNQVSGSVAQIQDPTSALTSGVPLSSSGVDTTQLPSNTLPQINLSGWVPTITRLQAFANSVVNGVFLPYRIARYFMYNQSYHKAPDLAGFLPWDLNHEPWSSAVGLVQAPTMVSGSYGGSDPVVAIIDSGMDYNHPTLHGALWMNPSPWRDSDGHKDRYGWDFISQDSRPFDDGYHGTQVASVVIGVAPKAKIMPLKIFNPWGVTTSAAVYAAFVYAVDHGAQVILCSWASGKSSDAISMGISYARDHGVVVVASAGDDGMDLAVARYYPAVLSAKYDNVLTVTAVDAQDRLIQAGYTKANYDSHSVQLAAPGADIPVAQPRSGFSRETSSDLAAAMVAGALARYLDSNESYQQGMKRLLTDSDSISSLETAVQGGLRLHIRK